jgi:thiol-disulfide isomerase/thioredoxin
MLKALLMAGLLLAPVAASAPRVARGQTPRAPEAAGRGASKSPAARPKVTEINEDALKSLLGVGAGRARPLLVNFWATWCGPCRDEFPDLVKIRAQYAAEKLDFVLVSLDDPTDIGTAVPEFLSEVRAVNFPSYLLHAEDDSVAINHVDPTWSGELPATFLYDRSGALVFKHKGRVKPAELRAALDQALKDKPQEAGAQK